MSLQHRPACQTQKFLGCKIMVIEKVYFPFYVPFFCSEAAPLQFSTQDIPWLIVSVRCVTVGDVSRWQGMASSTRQCNLLVPEHEWSCSYEKEGILQRSYTCPNYSLRKAPWKPGKRRSSSINILKALNLHSDGWAYITFLWVWFWRQVVITFDFSHKLKKRSLFQ